MPIITSFFIVIGLICGLIYMLQLKKIRDRKLVHALVRMLLGGAITLIFGAVILLIGNKEQLAYLAYSGLYISYAITLFFYLWFVSVYTNIVKFNPFKSPFLYLTLVNITLLIGNYYSHNIYTIQYKLIGSNMYWTVEAGYLFHLYTLAWFGEALLGILYCLLRYIKSAQIYRIRYLCIIIFTFFQLGIEALSHQYNFPIYVKCFLILAEGFLYLYMIVTYSPTIFINAALLFAAEKMNDGIVLYNEYDQLAYINEKLKSILDEDLLNKFENKEYFDSWINDQIIINDIFMKKINFSGQDYYYNVYKHEFVDNRSYVGVCYSLQDISTSLERVRVVEQANEELVKAAHMKSDFLANMSHEIRTPMNAVIGMAEMALREDMTDAARDYIRQLRSSGRNLLNIINDILDFSKIESGKMDIIPEPYSLVTELNDITSSLMTRIGDKQIELTIYENPLIPCEIEGDILRIRQILINLTNNAIKFTTKGSVHIRCDYRNIDDENVMLTFNVMDTGMGIKQVDLDKIFVSFQQVDSKRNRAIEGTGLGLAISKSLIEAMGGTIGVRSEYGKGSDFYFEIPQKVINWSPSLSIKNSDKIFAFGMFDKKMLAKRFFSDTNHMGVFSAALGSASDFYDVYDLYSDVLPNKNKYLFFSENNYTNKFENIIKENEDIVGIMLIDYNSTFKSSLPNLRVIRKPLSTASIAYAFNNKEIGHDAVDTKAFQVDFKAPDACVLVVDDNSVNLTVAEGLLKPLDMKIYTALSGQDAINLITEHDFDLIYMDHMMPGMDGVETTHVIRRMFPTYKEIPILAFTANAINGAKEYFLKEGMNDFIAKPVEVRDIISKTKQWLPAEKIQKGNAHNSASGSKGLYTVPVIAGLDTNTAVDMIGSSEIYITILNEYYKNIDKNYLDLKEAFDAHDLDTYKIKVHALKSASKQIGAMILSSKAADLEQACADNNIDFVNNNAEEVFNLYRNLQKILSEYFDESNSEDNDGEKEFILAEKLSDLLNKMKEACDNLDMDEIEAIVEELSNYKYEDNLSIHIQKLIEAAQSMDVDTCIELSDILLDII